MRSAVLLLLAWFICSHTALYAQGGMGTFWSVNQSGDYIWDGNPSNKDIDNTSGTWDLSTKNWTRAKGASNSLYIQGSKPHFGDKKSKGKPGIVTLATPIKVEALYFTEPKSDQFELTGSTLSGTKPLLPIDVDKDVSSIISSAITGSSGLTKTGDGTLILSGINDYDGATNINDGTLSLPDSTSWGALPTGAVNVNAGTLSIAANYPYVGTCGDWMLNGVNMTPFCYYGAMALTNNSGSQTGSAYYKTKIRTDGDFSVTFTYYVMDDKAGDGMAFVLQNTSATALGNSAGSCGGCLGYQGVTNSMAVLFNIFTGNGVGMQYATNGSFSTSGYVSTSPVVLNSGNAINVFISYTYATKTLAVSLAEQNTTHTYSTSYSNVDIPTLTGSPVAWIGFSAACGGAHATQGFGNFAFSDRAWNVKVNAASMPNANTSGSISLADAPNLGGKVINILLNGTTTGFTWNAVTWTGTATGTPTLQLNGTTVSSGVASSGTTITYSATAGIQVAR